MKERNIQDFGRDGVYFIPESNFKTKIKVQTIQGLHQEKNDHTDSVHSIDFNNDGTLFYQYSLSFNPIYTLFSYFGKLWLLNFIKIICRYSYINF